MPWYTPSRALRVRHGLPHAMWFVTTPSQENQGVVVKSPGGEFSWQKHPEGAVGTVYDIGREGYYLTLAETREAITNSDVYGISYVDDYNDEYQDYYICNPATNDPGVPATEAEAIA